MSIPSSGFVRMDDLFCMYVMNLKTLFLFCGSWFEACTHRIAYCV